MKPQERRTSAALSKPLAIFSGVWAKVRYAHQGEWCTIEQTGEDKIHCSFEKPVRAITPGQAVVFYDGEYILGGGVID